MVHLNSGVCEGVWGVGREVGGRVRGKTEGGRGERRREGEGKDGGREREKGGK